MSSIEYIKKYDYNDKKKFIYRIQNLKNKKLYIKLFKYIISNDIKYSINSNGVFFNLNQMDDIYLDNLDVFLKKLEMNSDTLTSSLTDSSSFI